MLSLWKSYWLAFWPGSGVRLLPLAALAWVLAGCESGKQSPPQRVPFYALPPTEPVVVTNPPPAVIPAPVTPPPVIPPPVTPPPAVSAPAPIKTPAAPSMGPLFSETWVSLEAWCDAAGLPKPKPIRDNATHTYTLPAPGGLATLTANRRVVQWAGLELWLGFAPRLNNDLFQVHASDAQKTILPLLLLNGLKRETNRCVVIDPGHGGRSVGTQNIITGKYEKDYTLDWAKRVQSLLATNGWKVVLTRSNDVDIALSNRVAVAEQCQAALFISLHFNSAEPRRERQGLATFCLTPAGLPSSLIRDPEEEARQLRATFPNNSHDFRNFQYALKFHRSLIMATGWPDEGVQRARFMTVLRGQNRPAILIEGGYLSNPQEARLIADPHFRQKMADAVARVLIE